MLASSPITSWQTDAETMEIVTGFIFLDSKITVDGDCSHVIKNSCSKKKKTKKKNKKTNLAPFKKSYDQTIQHIKKQRQNFANQGSYSQSYGFSRSSAWM